MSVAITEVEPILRRVRGIVLPYHGKVEHRSKSELTYDIVTDLDIQVENFLREELAKIYPEIVFVGEETGGDRFAAKKWLCDPIDGTAHFVRGTPFCTTMLAYIENGVVMFSVIYDFVNDQVYHAQRGKGAFCDGLPIHVSSRTLKGSYLSWETHLQKEENLQKHLLLTRKSSFFKTICAGYEFILVATGKIEGRICFDPFGKDYDFAAGSLLVTEAGGIVANIGKRNYDYTNLDFIATNPTVYNELTTAEDAIFPMVD